MVLIKSLKNSVNECENGPALSGYNKLASKYVANPLSKA